MKPNHTAGVPACGACPGDGTVCKTNCRLAEDSPTLLSDATIGALWRDLSQRGHAADYNDFWNIVKAVESAITHGVAAVDPFAITKVAEWPKERRVGRREDMSPTGHLEVMLDGDSDVIVAVTTGSGVDDFAQSSVEFCTVGAGGGSSPRTRAALVSLMLAIEADNAESPRKAWPPAEGRTARVDVPEGGQSNG